MKRTILLESILIFSIAASSWAQWLPMGAASTDPIFHPANVGVGPADPGDVMFPASRLQVTSGNILLSNAWGLACKTNAGAAALVFQGDGNNNMVFGSGALNSWQNVIFYANAVERMRIDPNGNVALGIAPSLPQSQLHMNGANGSGITMETGQTRARIFSPLPGWAGFSINAKYSSGTGWTADDATKSSWFVKVDNSSGDSFIVYRAPAGAIGSIAPLLTLDSTGKLTASGGIAATYQDIAEWVPSGNELTAGTVVVLDREQSNHVRPSEQAYDTAVAGVVSAEPGIVLGQPGEAKSKIATTGRVRVRVDATAAPIQIGDLLVTSGKTGLAMKSEPVEIGGRKFHQPGTVIGKALQPLAGQQGEILVLLSLQ